MENDSAGRQSRQEARPPRPQTEQARERLAGTSPLGHGRHTADLRRGGARPAHEHAHAGGRRAADERDTAATSLTGRELLVLQLLGVGYSREQLAALARMPATAIEEAEHSACAALGADATQEAVELARHRRLIL